MIYRPEFGAYSAPKAAHALRRARLFIGGTYFRTRTPARQGNKISLQIVQDPQDALLGKLVVTNHNTVATENIIGPVDIQILEQNLSWDEKYLIQDVLTAPKLYRVLHGEQTDLGSFKFGKLFSLPGKFTVKMTLKPEATAETIITIQARVKEHQLVPLTITTPEEEGIAAETRTGFDPAKLREAVNAADPWIEMLERSGTPESTNPEVPAVPLEEKFDEQDDGVDAEFIVPFGDTYMSGADGLPDHPVSSDVGLPTFMIHTNFSEQPNGTMESVYDMYEWIGGSAGTGEWKLYLG